MTTDAQSAAPLARTTLLMLSALSALAFMDRQILAVLLVPVQAEFALTDLQIGLVTGMGFALTFGLIGLPLGRVADKHVRCTLVAWCRGFGGALAALGAAAGGAWTLAATRAGGAISDAGGGPASMSMIADLYPPHQRSRAMSIFTMGASLGSLLALIVGAWVAQHHGWRATLFCIGATTLVASVALRVTVREPLRGRFTGAPAGGGAVGPVLPHGAVNQVWHLPVARWLIIAAGFALLAGYSFGAWNFAYLMRAHGLSSQQAGWVAGLSALGSLVGGPVSGALTDRLARRDSRWQVGVPILGLCLALPAGLIYLTLGTAQLGLAVALVIGFAFFISFWIAPTYAAISLVVPPERRAVASAMLLLVGAVGGSGFGPVVTGALSDVLATYVQGDPLRYALGLMLSLLIPALLAFTRAMAAYPAAHCAASAGPT